MKSNILILLVFLLSVMSFSMQAQESTEKVKGEILQTLQRFNTAAQNSNTDQICDLFVYTYTESCSKG